MKLIGLGNIFFNDLETTRIFKRIINTAQLADNIHVVYFLRILLMGVFLDKSSGDSKP